MANVKCRDCDGFNKCIDSSVNENGNCPYFSPTNNMPRPSTTIKIEVTSEGGRTILEFVKSENVEELRKESFFRALLLMHENNNH